MIVAKLACSANGCCHGRPCDLPWAITFAAGAYGPAGITCHPTQFYWSSDANMPTTREHWTAAAVETDIYVIDGWVGSARSAMGTGTLAGRIYVMGGEVAQRRA